MKAVPTHTGACHCSLSGGALTELRDSLFVFRQDKPHINVKFEEAKKTTEACGNRLFR